MTGGGSHDEPPAPTPTTLPCPAWCELPAGHPFDSWITDSSDLFRSHERTFGQGRGAVGVQAGERALSACGPVDPEPDPPTIWTEGLELTASQARDLAGNLLAAAAACDAVAAEAVGQLP